MSSTREQKRKKPVNINKNNKKQKNSTSIYNEDVSSFDESTEESLSQQSDIEDEELFDAANVIDYYKKRKQEQEKLRLEQEAQEEQESKTHCFIRVCLDSSIDKVYKMDKKHPLFKLMKRFAEDTHNEYYDLRFYYEDNRIHDRQTLEDINFQNNDTIIVTQIQIGGS